MSTRVAEIRRATKETDLYVRVDLDGRGEARVKTGIGFFDHMLEALARHGLLDLTVEGQGDLHVDGHHTVEDVAITLGEAFREAMGDKAGIRRFASGLFPLDGPALVGSNVGCRIAGILGQQQRRVHGEIQMDVGTY